MLAKLAGITAHERLIAIAVPLHSLKIAKTELLINERFNTRNNKRVR